MINQCLRKGESNVTESLSIIAFVNHRTISTRQLLKTEGGGGGRKRTEHICAASRTIGYRQTVRTLTRHRGGGVRSGCVLFACLE